MKFITRGRFLCDGESTIECTALVAALASGKGGPEARGLAFAFACKETYGCSYGPNVDAALRALDVQVYPFRGKSDLASIVGSEPDALRRTTGSPKNA